MKTCRCSIPKKRKELTQSLAQDKDQDQCLQLNVVVVHDD